MRLWRLIGLVELKRLETQELPIPAVAPMKCWFMWKPLGIGVWDPFEREAAFAKEFNIKPVFPLVLDPMAPGTVEAVGPQVSGLEKGTAFTEFPF